MSQAGGLEKEQIQDLVILASYWGCHMGVLIPVLKSINS